MPVHDAVLGARIITGGDAVARQLAIAGSNDADLSAGDRQVELDTLAALPGAHVELVIESEEGARYLYVLQHGDQQTFAITDSRSPTQAVPPRGTVMPSARTRVAADEVRELLAHDEADVVDDRALQLPYHWPTRDQMLADLAKIGALVDAVALLAEVGERRYDVEIAHGSVTCTPLYPHAPHRLDRVLAIVPDLAEIEPPVTVPFVAAVKRRPPPPLDPARPLTTGTAQQRERALGDILRAKRIVLASLIEAVRDEANRDDRYAELRRRIYHFLAKYDRPDVCALWLWALREETDGVADTVTYIGWRLDAVIAKLPDELAAARARGDTRTAARIERLQAQAR